MGTIHHIHLNHSTVAKPRTCLWHLVIGLVWLLSWLVVWKHVYTFVTFPYIGNVINPIDWLIFFRGVGFNHQAVRLRSCHICQMGDSCCAGCSRPSFSPCWWLRVRPFSSGCDRAGRDEGTHVATAASTMDGCKSHPVISTLSYSEDLRRSKNCRKSLEYNVSQ